MGRGWEGVSEEHHITREPSLRDGFDVQLRRGQERHPPPEIYHGWRVDLEQDLGRGIAAADDGIYLVGITYPDGESDAVLLKYDPEGRLIWARRWGVVEGAIGRGVAVDDGGLVYVAGYVGGMTANETRALLLKYGPDGDLIWNRTWGETGKDYCLGVTVDDGVYVGGSRGVEGGVQTVVGGEPRSRSEMYLAKFDFDGDMIWMRSWESGVENFGWALSAWKDHVYQVGFTQEAGDADAVLLGYDSSGVLRFSSFWGGNHDDYAWGVTRGGKFIYVVGHTFSTEPGSLKDALIMKYDSDGTLLWNVTWGGFGLDLARSTVVVEDRIYVVGITYDRRNDGQAFLLWYTSPNETENPLMARTSAAAIALGLVTWMTLILESVAQRTGRQVLRG